jgi:hypothetical protein
MTPADIKPGMAVRLLTGRARDRIHTFTARGVDSLGEVQIDNGAPDDGRHRMSGASIYAWVKPKEIEPWGDAPLNLTTAATQAIRAIEAERRLASMIERLRNALDPHDDSPCIVTTDGRCFVHNVTDDLYQCKLAEVAGIVEAFTTEDPQ